jgi:hypothetical protein
MDLELSFLQERLLMDGTAGEIKRQKMNVKLFNKNKLEVLL